MAANVCRLKPLHIARSLPALQRGPLQCNVSKSVYFYAPFSGLRSVPAVGGKPGYAQASMTTWSTCLTQSKWSPRQSKCSCSPGCHHFSTSTKPDDNQGLLSYALLVSLLMLLVCRFLDVVSAFAYSSLHMVVYTA